MTDLVWFSLASFLAILALVPPAIELVQRPTRVPWWWGACLLPFLALGLWFYNLDATLNFRTRLPIEDAATWFQAVFGGVGLGLLWMVSSLSVARWLRPNGEVEARAGRWRWVALAVVVLLVLPAGLAFDDRLVWPGLGAMATLVWVGCLFWDGSPRVERAGAVAGGWLISAALCGWCMLGQTWLTWSGESPTVLHLFCLGGTAGLSMATWWLGRIDLRPVGVMCALGLGSLGITYGHWLSLVWLPPGVEVPAYKDLLGVRRDPVVRALPICHEAPLVGGSQDISCPFWAPTPGAYAPDTRLSDVVPRRPILIDGGRGWIPTPSSFERVVLHEERGRVVLPDGTRVGLGPELHGFLQTLPRGVLVVPGSSHWTLADYVALCASYGGECELSAARPD